jgi:hypothetical protein
MMPVDDRPSPALAADEASTLLGFLEFQRATLAWKCGGLNADQLRTTLAPSTLTLGGLLKHAAFVEVLWFSRFLHGQEPKPPWDDDDIDALATWAWESAAHDAPEQLFAVWNAAVTRSRSLVMGALATGDLGQRAKYEPWQDQGPSLRWILCHMIEEYARHNGHADLIREAIDGTTGE